MYIIVHAEAHAQMNQADVGTVLDELLRDVSIYRTLFINNINNNARLTVVHARN